MFGKASCGIDKHICMTSCLIYDAHEQIIIGIALLVWLILSSPMVQEGEREEGREVPDCVTYWVIPLAIAT